MLENAGMNPIRGAIGFVIIATVLVVIVGYSNPPPADPHWIAPGKASGGGVTMHSERG